MPRVTPRIVRRVLKANLTYLDKPALLDLRKQMRSIERSEKEGAVIEAGCALGGSTIVIASAKARDRPMYVYDVFGLIPPPGETDGEDVKERYRIIVSGASAGIRGDTYYGYERDLLSRVIHNFNRFDLNPGIHSISFVKGLVEETLHPEGPVVLAHIDADWYESVKICLERIAPKMVVGGRFVIDDYHMWSGCKRAVDEFVDGHPTFAREQHARLHLIRTHT